MPRYMLSCECGEYLPVETGQAGEKLVCRCGRTLEVPTLRHLRHLPTETVERPGPSAESWGARQGIATLCLLAAGVLAIVAAWSRLTEPTLPQFNPEAHTAHMDQSIDALTPAQAFQLMVYEYVPLAERGFEQFEHPHEGPLRVEIARQRFFQRVMLILAGLFVAGAATAALWPAPKTRRV